MKKLPPAFEPMSKNLENLRLTVLGNEAENALPEPCQEQEIPQNSNTNPSRFPISQISMKQPRKPKTPKYAYFDLYLHGVVVAELRLTQSELALWRKNKGKNLQCKCIKIPKVGERLSPNEARKKMSLGVNYLNLWQIKEQEQFKPSCDL